MSAASIDALGTNRDLGSEAYRPADFPGCESFHLPAGEIDHYEGRLEFWDGVTETAWKVCEPTSIQHEQPSRQLAQMAGQFAMVRGSRIVCFGSADLVRLDAAGRKRWLMQADEVLYLHPDRVRLQGPAIDVDADPLPEVVLEVDHTTDVRRRKLDIYKESGFPEIWVLVPWEASVRAPGLAIHVRRGEDYREETASHRTMFQLVPLRVVRGPRSGAGSRKPSSARTSRSWRTPTATPCCSIVQEVSYRKTGVQLEIKPLVQANGLVDLAISRQLSEAVPSADTSLAGSPTILNRQISTSLTLRDGGSLLMGGLISGNQGAGTTGVPVSGQLPVLGRLFRTDAVQEDRTELMVMVTPYVIADHEEGWELTRRIREQFDLHTEIQR